MDEVKSVIATYIEDQFLVTYGADFQGDTNLFESGIMDSYGYVQLVEFLQRNFDVVLSDDEFLTNVMGSMDRMSDTIQSRLSEVRAG